MIADGVYTDLPERDYVADPALSGSAFARLLNNPPDWKWEQSGNALWVRRETEKTRAGTAYHKAILEGLDAYERRYAVAPDEDAAGPVLKTAEHLKDWLRARELKVSGPKEELMRRVLEADPDAPVWDVVYERAMRGRHEIDGDLDAHIRLTVATIQASPAASKLVSGGRAEVSVFWTDGDVRYKARLDYLRPTAVVDLKTFSLTPRRGLVRDLLAHAITNQYDLQAVHNWRAVAAIRDHLEAGRIWLRQGESAYSWTDAAPLRRLAKGPHTFVWLWARSEGAPTIIATEFEPGSLVWAASEQKIARALEHYHAYRGVFGEGLWVRDGGLVRPDLSEWPVWATEIA